MTLAERHCLYSRKISKGNTLRGKWFSYKSIPNALSVLRMLLVPPFIRIIYDIFVYGCTKNLGLVIIFFTIILTDIADGYLARRLKCASQAGAKLDVLSDTVYTIFSLTAFAYFKIIPAWFIVIMILKLLEFTATSRLMSEKQNGKRPLLFDKIGRLSVCMVMLLPGLFVFRCIITGYKTAMNVTVYIVTIMLILSFINRTKTLNRVGKN